MSKLSESRIALIGAQSARWPNHTTGRQWQALWSVIDEAREIVRKADAQIAAVEADGDLAPAGKLRRMAGIAMDAITGLDNLDELRTAEQRVASWVETLDGRREAIGRPSDAFDIALQTEIRAFLRNKGDGAVMFAMSQRTNPAMAAAVANAPAFLSGLTNEQHAAFIQAAEGAMSPEVVAQKRQHEDALAVARKAVDQAKAAVAERGQLLKTPSGYKAKDAA